MLDDPAFVSAQYSQTDPLQDRISLHKRFSTDHVPWPRWLFNQLLLVKGGLLLEVGSGPGDLWIENRDRWPEGWTIHLSDLHSAMLLLARKSIGSRHGLTYHLADAQALPHPADQYDLVVANHMLYHVADLDRALAELSRVLKPGALLVAATNGAGHMLELRQLMSRFLPEWLTADDSGSTASAKTGFTLENGRRLAANHFQQIEVRRHANNLRVTELEPLMAYIRSRFPGREIIDEAALKPISEVVKKQITEQGAFEIAKEAGCIIARKG
jgi:SAM-dependent methyltransferase